jgi:hypothetical protein
MNQVETFEALTTRRRPAPPPPWRRSRMSRPASTPMLDLGSQEESDGGAPNSGDRGATVALLSASRGRSESAGETAVAVVDGRHGGAAAAPPRLFSTLPRPRLEAAVFTPGSPFSIVTSQAPRGASVSEPDLGRPEHSIGASPVMWGIIDNHEAYNNNLDSSVDAVETGPRSQQPYEYTDLDLLVARLDNPAEADSYEDSLTITDFIGPAVSSSSGGYIQAVENLPVAPVQVERRRITKDGRKKLKLSLMGVVIDRCSVCMSQFKQHELGVLLPCHHSLS